MTSGNPYARVDGWEFFGAASARDFFARKRVKLAPGHAVPFLHDTQSRGVFITVTLDSVTEEKS